MYNDDWMRERGFLEEEKTKASEIVAHHNGKRLITADVNDPLSKVMVEMKQFEISHEKFQIVSFQPLPLIADR